MTDNTPDIDGLKTRIAVLEAQKHEADLIRNLIGHMHVCRTVSDARSLMSLYLPQLFPNASGTVYIHDRDLDQYEVVSSWGGDTEPAAFGPNGCYAILQHSPYIVAEGTGLSACPHETAQGHYACLPLLDEDRPIGLLYIRPNGQKDGTEEAVFALATEVSQQLSFSVANILLREQLRLSSVRDPLTGLSNRRFLEENLAREESRAKRANMALTLMMIDVDRFKTFNDEYGFIAGDEVLKTIANILRQMCRTGDIACRYRAQQFMMIFPNMDEDIALARAEQIRSRIEAAEISFQGQKLSGVTASLGFALYPAHGETIVDVVEASGHALKAAKDSGRNRAMIATGR